MAIQVMVTGKVVSVKPLPGQKDAPEQFEAELHEKVWNGQSDDIRIWTLILDSYQGKRLMKANATIKYFGFHCDAMRIEWEWQGEKKGMVIWYSARARSFFTL